MSRTLLTDSSGRWFDDEKAIKFEERTRWDGRNMVSVATGSQWEFQDLFYTQSCNWVLREISAIQGVPTSYSTIDEDRAIRWLMENERWHDDGIDQLPQSVSEAVKAGFETAEL